MDLLAYRNYCLQKKGVTESFPFDAYTLVYKVAGKMFTLANIQPFVRINVKCDPAKAIELREQYRGVVPAWHMNKKHWNSLLLEEGLRDAEVFAWIDDSYDLVVSKLPRRLGDTFKE